jgi:hypothetical protein
MVQLLPLSSTNCPREEWEEWQDDMITLIGDYLTDPDLSPHMRSVLTQLWTGQYVDRSMAIECASSMSQNLAYGLIDGLADVIGGSVQYHHDHKTELMYIRDTRILTRIKRNQHDMFSDYMDIEDVSVYVEEGDHPDEDRYRVVIRVDGHVRSIREHGAPWGQPWTAREDEDGIRFVSYQVTREVLHRWEKDAIEADRKIDEHEEYMHMHSE